MVFLATPVILTVARMEVPSTKHRTTWARFAVSSLFILTSILDDLTNVKQTGQIEQAGFFNGYFLGTTGDSSLVDINLPWNT